AGHGGGDAEGDYQKAYALVDGVAKQGAKGGLAALTHFLRAQCNAALGEWASAESEFRKTLQFSSSSQPARIGLAVCLTRQGRFEEARLEFSNALKDSGRESHSVPDWKIHVQIARTCLLQQSSRFESQLPSEFKESIEALSSFPQALASQQILMLEALGYWDNGTSDVASSETTAIETCGNMPEFWRMYVNYLSRQRRWREACEAIERLETMLGEDQVELRLRLAYAKGDREGAGYAISKLHQTGQLTPQEHALLELRIEFAVGERAKALERAGALLKKYPQETRFMRELANIAWVEGNALLVSAAMDAMEESGLCRARELQIWNLKLNWLRCLQRSAKTDDVATLKSTLKQLSSRQDLSQQEHLLLGQCSDSLGMKRAAVVHYLEAFARGCRSEMVALRLARLLYERSQADKALDILLTIDGPQVRALSAAMICEILPELSVSPHKHATLERYLESVANEGEQGPSFDFALFLSNFAMLKSRTGEPEVGIRYLRKAIAKHPDSIVLKNNLALLLSQYQGAHTEALELLESALLVTGANATLLDSKAHVL
ncbi:MAG: tetratricopeptide repeat protein, partial [Planctomycetota bacterium]